MRLDQIISRSRIVDLRSSDMKGALEELLGDPDPARAQRATQAMLGMSKIDIGELRRAADDVSAT